jgi:hypothetical protein
MSEMGIAAGTLDFSADHAVGGVIDVLDRAVDGLVE